MLYSPGVFNTPDQRIIRVTPSNLADDLTRHTRGEDTGRGFVVKSWLFGTCGLRAEVFDSRSEWDAVETEGVSRGPGSNCWSRKVIGDPEADVVSRLRRVWDAIKAQNWSSTQTVSAVPHRVYA